MVWRNRDSFPLLILGTVLIVALAAVFTIIYVLRDEASAPEFLPRSVIGAAVAPGVPLGLFANPNDAYNGGGAYLTVETNDLNSFRVSVRNTNQSTDQYIYKTGYYSKGSGSSKQWQSFSFDEAPVSGTNWIHGTASYTLSAYSGAEAEEYVIAFVCRKYAGKSDYVCGPQGSSPSSARWNWTIQNFTTTVQSCGGGNISCSDGSCANLSNDINHCGSCVTACNPSAQACNAGSCVNLCVGTAGQFCNTTAIANANPASGFCKTGSCSACAASFTYDSNTKQCRPACTAAGGQFCNASTVPNAAQNNSGYCAAGSCWRCNDNYAFDGVSCVSSSNACTIGGSTYGNGAPNPQNSCQYCNTALSTSAWSNRAANTACTLGSGAAGTCNGNGVCQQGCTNICTPGNISCATTNPKQKQTCVQQSSGCYDWGPAQDCGGGQLCVSDTCQSPTCIGSIGFCAPTQPTGSSPVSAGTCLDGSCYTCGSLTRCAASNSCINTQTDNSNCGACGRACSGSTPTCSAGQCISNCPNPPVCTAGQKQCVGTNAFQVCSIPSTGCPAWGPSIGCPTGWSCQSGECKDPASTCAGCYIDGKCYNEGAPNPSNTCQVCTKSSNPTGWSNKPDTPVTTCTLSGGGNGACKAGVCTCTGCTIGGQCYNDGAVNPNNACQYCNKASPSVWSNKPDTVTTCTLAGGASGVCSSGQCVTPTCLNGKPTAACSASVACATSISCGTQVFHCRSINNGAYQWYAEYSSEANCPGLAACSTAKCGNPTTTYYCLNSGWSSCNTPNTCANGVCSPPCTSSCSAWQTQCSGTQIQTCTLQSNGCYAWSTATNCPGSQTCQGTTCQNPSCTSLSTEYFCAQYRPTWSDAITSGACPGTQGCYRCQADHPTYCATRGVCANMQSDDNNCGGCGIVCSGGQTCQNGVCSCASGTLGDSNNCGWCGNDCGTWVCDPVARTCAECLDSENDASNHYRNPQCMYANDGQACMSNQCSCVDDGHCQDGWTCNTATHRCELI